MEQIKGYKLGVLPTGRLEKICDLLEYDGPLLTHFFDIDSNHSFLYYWVDYNSEFNRWLVWKVTPEQLHSYVHGSRSLKELMEDSENKDFIYSVDIDENLNYNNVIAIEVNNVPEVYLIEEDSYYTLSVPKIYETFLEHYAANKQYLLNLRDTAVYYRIVPDDKEYSTTVSILDAGDFLKKIGSSFVSFLEFDFFNSFKHETGDAARLFKSLSQLKKGLIPRIVALKYGSFEVGISADVNNIKKVENYKYIDWQRSIVNKYKNDVVDVDYSSEEELKIIAQKFPEEEVRKRIYSPYIDLLGDDKKFTVEVADNKRNFKEYSKVSKEKERIIIPKKEDENDKGLDTKFLYNMIVELGANDDISTLKSKNLQSGLLFAQQVAETSIPLNEIVHNDYTLKLKEPVIYQLLRESGTSFIAKNDDFQITENGNTGEEAGRMFQQKFYLNYREIKDGFYKGKDKNRIKKYLDIVAGDLEV